MSEPLTTNEAEKQRRLNLRLKASANFDRAPTQEHIQYNTHHAVYQYTAPNLQYHQFSAEFMEMNDAQLERWIGRLHAARAALAQLPEAETTEG